MRESRTGIPSLIFDSSLFRFTHLPLPLSFSTSSSFIVLSLPLFFPRFFSFFPLVYYFFFSLSLSLASFPFFSPPLLLLLLSWPILIPSILLSFILSYSRFLRLVGITLALVLYPESFCPLVGSVNRASGRSSSVGLSYLDPTSYLGICRLLPFLNLEQWLLLRACASYQVCSCLLFSPLLRPSLPVFPHQHRRRDVRNGLPKIIQKPSNPCLFSWEQCNLRLPLLETSGNNLLRCDTGLEIGFRSGSSIWGLLQV